MASPIATLTASTQVDPLAPLDGCWEWQGFITGRGYGQAYIGSQKFATHRLMYQLVVGPIPDGLVIDHLCRNRRCLNPRHLEPVTNHENILRGDLLTDNRILCLRRRHVLSSVGVYVDSEGSKRCRECRLESKRRYRQKQKVA